MSRASGRKGQPARPPVLGTDLPADKQAGYGIDDRDIPGGQTHLVNYPTVTQKVPTAEPLDEFRGMMAHGVPPKEAETGHYDRQAPAGNRREPRYARIKDPVTPVPVYIVEEGAGGRPLRTVATDRFSVPAAGTEPIRIAGRDRTRTYLHLLVETAGTGTTRTSQNATAVPAAFSALAAVTGLPAATYQVTAYAYFTGTPGAGDADNVQLWLNGASQGTLLIPPVANGAPVPFTIEIAAPAGSTIELVNPAAGSAGTTYHTFIEVTAAGAAGVRFDHEVGNLDVGLGALLRAGAVSYLKLECEDEMFAVSADASACTISVVYEYGVPGAGP